ncbi:MAG TPA: glycerate kinase [Dehalococcoidia bacterium]|nr:glycerate kinase [Dehalococcoidia bacterium]
MRIVVAPQEYKGTLTAEEAAVAIATGARRALPDAEVEAIAMPDGGPGTVQAIASTTEADLQRERVTGPLGEPVDAIWALLPGNAAIIEMAAAAGLTLVRENHRDPRLTTTFGVGELVGAALDAGCERLIIGLGGSATNDGGAGMAQALGARLLDANGDDLPHGGAALARLASIDISALDARIAGAGVTGATDVHNPLCGPEGASFVYGPQKGATDETAAELDTALGNYARVIKRDLGVAVVDVPGAGAAGGLGAGLIAFLGARLRPGFDVVAEVVELRDRMRGADLVITGEGRLDGQTRYGKTVAGVISLAAEAGAAVIVVPGSLGEGWEWALTQVAAVEPVNAAHAAPLTTRTDAAERLAATTERAVRAWRRR